MQKHLSEWQSRISTQPIPILSRSVEKLNNLLGMRNIQIYDVLNIVEQDPGLAVQVLRSANSKNQKRNNSDLRSIEQAIKVLEISNIQKLAQTLPKIEQHTTPDTRKLLFETFYKAYHSAKQAEHWARLQQDEMPEEIYCAAFMHYLGEMYIAIYVPNLMTFVRNMQLTTNLVPEEAEYVVLGFTFAEMTMSLAESWHLPKFVKQSLHIENVEESRSYGVILASELIQAANYDWYSEKTWGLQLAAATWLDMKPEKLMTDTHQVAATVARNCLLSEITPLANKLLLKPIAHEFTENKTITGTIKKESVTICLTPQQDEFDDALDKMLNYQEQLNSINEVIKTALHGMHDGIGLNRVAFYLLVKDHSALHNYMSIGVENDPIFNKFQIDLTNNNIFVDILKKQQAVWVNNTNSDTIIKRLPKEFYEMISIETFYTMSVFIKNKAVGLFYADRHSRTCGMDEKGYTNFKLMAKQTAVALEYYS